MELFFAPKHLIELTEKEKANALCEASLRKEQHMVLSFLGVQNPVKREWKDACTDDVQCEHCKYCVAPSDCYAWDEIYPVCIGCIREEIEKDLNKPPEDYSGDTVPLNNAKTTHRLYADLWEEVKEKYNLNPAPTRG